MKRNYVIFSLLFLIGVLFRAGAAHARPVFGHCTIHVTVQNSPAGYVYLYNRLGQTPLDSVRLSGGRAQFKRAQSFLGFAVVVGEKRAVFCADEGDEVQVNIDFLPEFHYDVSGTASEARWKTLRAELSEAITRLGQSRSHSPEYIARRDSFDTWAIATATRLEQKNPTQALMFIGLYRTQITPLYPDPLRIQQMKAVYDRLDPALRADAADKYYRTLAEDLDYLAFLRVGRPMFDFVSPNSSGAPVRTVDLRGRYLLLDFWASWCGPCRQENQALKAHYPELKAAGLEILGISIDKYAMSWKIALEEDALPWRQVLMDDPMNNPIFKAYNTVTVPKTVLVSPQGIVLKINPTLEELRGLIRP